MRCKLLLTLLFSLPGLLFSAAAPPDEEITIHLSTLETLSPIYIGKIQTDNSAFSEEYLKQIHDVLTYDFAHNGFTKPIPLDPEKDKVLHSSNPMTAFSTTTWKNYSVPYVLKVTAQTDKLSFAVFTLQSGALKHFKDIPFEGSLFKDRRQVHKIADAIVHSLFAVQGVASQKILFSLSSLPANEHEWKAEIWECDSDGKNLRQVTKENSYCISPVVIPTGNDYKGNHFIYVSYKLSQPKIYIASLKDGVGKRLIDLRGNQILPAISQKRDMIAFICDAGGRADLFLQTIDPDSPKVEKPIQLYAYPKATQASPTFNPDGSKIAFVSDKDGVPRIYTISTKTHVKRPTPTLITKQNKESTCPSWSPDGKKLAYSSLINGVRQIWIYDFETGEETQLTSGMGNKENPSWASDNLHLVYNTTDGNLSELYVINLNQKEAVKISEGVGRKHYPCWSGR